jgi:membrane-bound metal-dependent hydrolase YbcI (DUF457 family)
MTGLILVSPFILTATVSSVLLLIGIFLGSLLPDSDASDRTARHKESVLFAFDAINERLIYPIILRIFHEKKRHRGILHTIIGVLIFSAILTVITGLTFVIFKIPFDFLMIGIGLTIGGILHLMEDCCTLSGVNPFYPKYKKYVFKGTISTNNVNERRPDQYFQFLAFLFVSLIVASIWFKNPQIQMIIITLIALVLSWSFFFLGCGIHKAALNR